MILEKPSGGGKRHGVRVACLFDDFAARQLRSQAAKFVKDVRTIRRKDDKSETEKVVLVDSSNEQKYIVGWGCEIADEWLTRGARNEIHICDSNMNGSYEREAISRRYPNNEIEILSVSEVMKEFSLLGRADCSLSAQEAHGGIEPAEHSVDPLIANNQAELERGLEGKYNTNLPLSHIRNTRYTLVNDSDLSLGEVVSSIQSYPSPEFLNSLPFIKKFFPTPLWGEGYFTKTTHENSCNLRHSEAHSPSAKKLQKTRRSARLFCNFEDTFNANENSFCNPAYK